MVPEVETAMREEVRYALIERLTALADDSIALISAASAAEDEEMLRKACAVFLNRVLRVKGRGIQGKSGTGDLLAKVQVVVPQPCPAPMPVAVVERIIAR